MILKTPKVHKKIAQDVSTNLKPIVEIYNKESNILEKSNPEILLDIFWTLNIIRSYSKIAFWGSLINDTLSGGESFKMLNSAIKYLSLIFNITNTGIEEIENQLEQKIVHLTSKVSLERLNAAFNNDQGALKDLVEEQLFDCDLEHLRRDIE